MAKKKKVKLVSVSYGIFGNPNKRKIEKVMTKWLNKGYRLVERDEIAGGCRQLSKTELTFIQDE